jgi:hypothetical protein
LRETTAKSAKATRGIETKTQSFEKGFRTDRHPYFSRAGLYR